MARDRQRAKQRRRRPAQGGAASTRSRARELGLDDPGTGAPDPLEHASGEVDQARLAEAGIGRGGPDEDVQLGGDDVLEDELYAEGVTGPVEAAPDEAEDYAPAPRRGSLRAAEQGEGMSRPVAEHGGNRVIAFLRACVDELRRVQWPDRKHVFQATAVVLGFVLIAGGWLGLMDAIWQPIINAIL